ncbi:MAG: adenosylcobinamide-GDP ribazoletransferase [Desulfobacteraceae bacterium]|nr:adenosylcobinamide-GDP ribazoletransferase [Desulfobacteraceae bacterium]
MKILPVHLAAALRFITILPAGAPEAYHPRAMIPYFPVVGLLLGLILAAADAAACRFLAQPAVGAIDVIVLTVLTGALHLDGLADTADGLFSHRNRETALSIMKDSRIGVMGATALACILLAKYGAFSALPVGGDTAWQRFLVLVLVPGYARSSMMAGIYFLPYARAGKGTASDLFTQDLKLRDFWGLFLCVLLSGLLGWRALAIIPAFLAVCTALIIFYRKRIKGVTGDMLGAMSEITEAFLFIIAAAAF